MLKPQLRPSAEKVFEDPWLRDPTCDVHIPSFSANWRKYRLKRKFKAAVLALVAERRMLSMTFTPESVDRMSLRSPRSSIDSLPSSTLNHSGAVRGDGMAEFDSLDLAILNNALGEGTQMRLGDGAPMSMSQSIDFRPTD